MIFLDTIIIVSLFGIFALIHSIFASFKIKKKIKKKFGDKIAFYRIGYNISSFLLLSIFYFIAPKPDFLIYDLKYPYDIFIVVLQVTALGGIIWSVLNIDGKEFLGTSQIKRWLNNNYENDLDEKSTFSQKGPFKYCRHPIYFFSILFLGLRPVMDYFYLVIFICVAVYFYVGSYFEEKRMLRLFGSKYEEYQKNVPKIIPKIKVVK